MTKKIAKPRKPTYKQLEKRIAEACDHLTGAAGQPYGESLIIYQCIDQAVRVLQDANYEKYVMEAKVGENGPDTYAWYTGARGEQ